VDGEAGVRGVLRILREEFDRAMAYCGFTDVESIERSAVASPR
jgi:isopentenyl diphosphate isomerase/L-lactate dehydrogenase-like FMN-dependent dehydrogenase